MSNVLTIYVENQVKDNFRTKKILEKFPHSRIIPIDHYSEIFNRKNQNFSLQKINPSLILAKKEKNFIQKVKSVSGVGLTENFYFSPMLNCPFDCMYCFLKGLYRSAFYTIFVNYEDFKRQIDSIHFPSFFFSGYDSDSLAMDHLTEFSNEFIPFFQNKPHLLLELRTKSVNINSLLSSLSPSDNVIIAFSLNPKNIVDKIERKTPSLESRIKAVESLQTSGWKTGLRFDPLIYHEGYQKSYQELFSTVFNKIDLTRLHSVTLGALRYPASCYTNIRKINNQNPLLAPLFQNSLKIFSYEEEKVEEMLSFCKEKLSSYVKEDKIFIYRDCS